MANEQNLKPVKSEKEARELGRKGGIASGKARRKKADFIKTAKAILDCALSEQNQKVIKAQYPELDDDEINYRTMILLKQMEKALKGDINSAKLIIDTTGEKPKDNIEAEVKLPVTNITVIDNKELKKKFEEYELNT